VEQQLLKNKISKISYIIPVFNEAQRISKSLELLKNNFAFANYKYEIIFVDDGSIDATKSIITDFINSNQLEFFRIIGYQKNKGKGFAVKYGMLNAADDAELFFFMDADLSTDLFEIDKFIDFYIHNDFDIIIGSRSLPNSQIRKHQSLLRESMGKFFNKIIRFIIGIKFIDTQCGFKLFNKKAKTLIFENLTINHFSFDVEIILLADKFGLKIIDLPVVWTNNSESKVNIISDSLYMLIDVIKLRLKHQFKA